MRIRGAIPLLLISLFLAPSLWAQGLEVGDKVKTVALKPPQWNFVTATRCLVYDSSFGTIVSVSSFGMKRSKTERRAEPCGEAFLVQVVFDDQGKCAETFAIPSNACKSLLAEEVGTEAYYGIEEKGLFGILRTN